MGLLGFLIVGLICGALAKAILSDRAVGGWLASLVIGVLGALLGGFLGSVIFDTGLGGFFEIRTWLLALGGSLLVLLIYGAITGRGRR
ncbi:GlsB/YeaQ/YmgE family stress response membrane protein [Actinotalea caeni]|uniref:GlsB/YeaQ/YmgE family stress response membrane protein n=1 Tax=Actinotalea caeni TaxID=1348467 RepID=UPI0012E2CEC0|nr:GlsB/YeaQ/YmgE family stress response membrane protein [Actinotalea caeni]HLV03142.1 GlsB/YeaQ/YmgE family stress response membrane protein [Actinomycetaceae bacterium]